MIGHTDAIQQEGNKPPLTKDLDWGESDVHHNRREGKLTCKSGGLTPHFIRISHKRLAATLLENLELSLGCTSRWRRDGRRGVCRLCQLITTHISPSSSHQLAFCADWSLHISHLTVHTNSPSVATDHYTYLTSQLTPTHLLCRLITTHFSPHSSHQLNLCANWSLHISHLTAHTNSPSVPTDHYTYLT